MAAAKVCIRLDASRGKSSPAVVAANIKSYLISNDDVELSMFVYPGDLESTNGFPVNNLEIDELTVNGVQILYQKFEDRTNSFRSLFTYNNYTYEVTVYSPTNADVLIEYLQRILSNQNQTSIDF